MNQTGKPVLAKAGEATLSSTHAQDLESMRYSVKATYRSLLEVDTTAGLRLLLHVVERPQMYHPWCTATSDGLPPHVRSGKPLNTSGGHGAAREMAQVLCEWLGQLAEQQAPDAFAPIINTVISGLHHDEVWNLLLRRAVVAGSTRLGSALAPVLASKTLFANSATWSTAGHLAARMSPQLGADQHSALEAAILELVSMANAANNAQIQQGLTARAQTLLNALSADKLGSAAAAVIAQAASLAPMPVLDDGRFDRFGVSASWEPDISLPVPMAQLADEIRRVTEQARSKEEEARTQSHPLLLDLWARLSTVTAADPPAAESEAHLHDLRLTLAERLTTVPHLTPDTELGQQVLAVLIDAAPETGTDADPVHEVWRPGLAAWGSTPSTNAVQGLVHLIFRPEWRQSRLADLASVLTGLLDASHVVYRYLAAQALPALYQDPDAAIDELERRLRSEPDQNNATQLLHHLNRYRDQHPQRIDDVLERLSELPGWAVLTSAVAGDSEVGSNDDYAVCVDMVVLLAAAHDTPFARRIATAWLANPVDHPHRATRGIAVMRGLLNPLSEAWWTAQGRAFGLLAAGLAQVADVFTEAAAADGRDETNQDRAIAAIKLADEIAQQLYFASGAFDSHQSSDTGIHPANPCRFAALALPLLDDLSAIHYPAVTQHIVEIADHIAHCDPRPVLLTAAVAVTHDPGYANESQGLRIVLALIRHYAAEHRNLLLSDTECTTAIRSMLGSFINRGWDEAIDLAEELHEMFT